MINLQIHSDLMRYNRPNEINLEVMIGALEEMVPKI